MPPPEQASARHFFADLLEQQGRLSAGRPLHLRGVAEEGRPFVAAGLADAARRAGLGPVLWVTPSEAQAEQLAQACLFFLGKPADDSVDPFGAQVAHFPLHQHSPYVDLSPDKDALADRLALLFRLLHADPPALIVASMPALMRLSPSRQTIDSASFLLLAGQELDMASLARGLVRAGYLNAPLVEEPGSFAIRGGIMDIFSPQLTRPIRLEWFGDQIESIRVFDPDSQRTVARLDSAFLGPVREIIQDEESTAQAIAAVERLADELDLPSHKLLSHRRNLKEGLRYFGMESLLPAFDPDLTTLFAYLPEQVKLCLDDAGAIGAAAKAYWSEVEESYGDVRGGANLAFDPGTMVLDPEVALSVLLDRPHLLLGAHEGPAETMTLNCTGIGGFREAIVKAAPAADPLAPLCEQLKEWRRLGIRTIFSAARRGRARQLRRMLTSRGLAVREEEEPFALTWLEQHTPNLFARIAPGDLDAGFVCAQAGVAVVPDAEVFGRSAKKTRKLKPSREVLRLEPGQLVVHMDFGIGQYRGLTKLAAGGSEADYLLLTFRDEDRLYLPVTRMNLIERYQAPEGSRPLLSKLGAKTWERMKQKIHQALLEMADELVRLEAARRSRPGEALPRPDEEYDSLQASFPFEETRDQKQAIDEVENDLLRDRPMDRLVCGDVGFGKTEVAIRAAYMNSLAGRQTLCLVPTTILALQHLATFRARLEPLSVRVEMLSRMTPKADQQGIVSDLAAGRVDVLIGTHRLLAADMQPRRLGLLIIDEEHRFGVRHKERIKKIKADVDVLTMTATPLPRTLQMSLTGLRDISVIRTPPPGRRSIRTFITRFKEKVIAEAIRRERARGGQVFLVHNFVRSMPAMQRFVERIVPEARVATAHGQMNERKLEQVMTDFVRREVDVLLCTSIIESGLDIPSANTIIVNRADRFGLAQLYQIRGRVGRSAERAYAYFLIPGLDSITADARKRLEALADHADLGSGFQIASRDLEIRGAGNLLGKAQSGHIKAIGYELYRRLLERALMEVRGQVSRTGPEPELNMPVPGFLPEDYIPDLDQRLDAYSRLSRAETEEDVYDLEQEFGDRFGPLPPEVLNLVELSALKTHLRSARVLRLDCKAGRLDFNLDTGDGFDPGPLVLLVGEQPERMSLDPSGLLRVVLGEEDRGDPLPVARAVAARLAALMNPVPAAKKI